MSGSERGAAGGVVNVVLRLMPDAEVDAEAYERLSRQLRKELADLDVESVAPAAGGPAPDGAKGADPLTLGAVVVALGTSGGVFAVLVETVRDWLARQHRPHRVSVTIDGDTVELERASPEQQRALVDAFVRRHSGGQPVGRRLALLIATYRYSDAGLRRLTAPAHDAEALAAVLRDPDVAGFDVTVLVNEPHYQKRTPVSIKKIFWQPR